MDDLVDNVLIVEMTLVVMRLQAKHYNWWTINHFDMGIEVYYLMGTHWSSE
jgi:hypothetical protein